MIRRIRRLVASAILVMCIAGGCDSKQSGYVHEGWLGLQGRLRMSAWENKELTLVAHRGVHFRGAAPENSLHGVELAAAAGFTMVECDTRETADGVMVVMHDGSVNAVCRTRDGYEKIEQEVHISRTKFEDLRNKYVLASDDERWRTPIPTFEEFLQTCKRCEVYPMVHYNAGSIRKTIELASRYFGNDFIFFDVAENHLHEARNYAPRCKVFYSMVGSSEGTVAVLDRLGGAGGCSTMQPELLTADFCAKCKEYGIGVQASTPEVSAIDALRVDGITYLLSDNAFPDIETAATAEYRSKISFTTEDLETDGARDGDRIVLDAGERIFLSEKIPEADFGGFNVRMEMKGACEISVPTAGTLLYSRPEPGPVVVDYMLVREEFTFMLEAKEPTVVSGLKITVVGCS